MYDGCMYVPCWRGLVVSSTTATEEIGAMGRVIESRQSLRWLLLYILKYTMEWRDKKSNKCKPFYNEYK
jgi:hypothetical protein